MWFHSILATLFALLAVLLMGVILLQRGKGVGLSGAFGGAGGHTAFGAKTGDVLTWATIVIAAVMLIFAIILNYVFVPLAPPPPPTITTPVSAPLPSPAGSPDETPAGSPAPTEGAGTPIPAVPVPAPSEATPPADTPKPGETTPAGGGDTPFWSARPDIFGADFG
jgi:preprotein translocase subunit SecG